MSIVALTCPDVPIRRAPLPPVECTTWCAHGDGHPDEIFSADQRCVSRAERIPVSRGGEVEVYVVGTASSAPMVSLCVDDGAHGVELRLSVAELDALLWAARRARGVARQASGSSGPVSISAMRSLPSS